ncbi:glycoside hydrolase [Acephala macrosclerotiorum]|nr:glycoside hydrolase [Acephala macrosclerotiorum]
MIAAPCPTMTFTYEGAIITAPYRGPGTPRSCLTSNTPAQTSASPAGSPATETGPGNGGPSVATSDFVAPTTSTLPRVRQLRRHPPHQGVVLPWGSTTDLQAWIDRALKPSSILLVTSRNNEWSYLSYSSSSPGADLDDIVNFIQATRNAIVGTALAGKPIGHADTWTAYVNGFNTAVISACDFLGVNAYPYFQNTQANGVANVQSLFEDAYQATIAVAQGKPIWVTKAGWPKPVSGQATASIADAESYWKSVGCGFAIDKIPTFWYDLDGGASPSFGVTASTTTPLYDLSCSS